MTSLKLLFSSGKTVLIPSGANADQIRAQLKTEVSCYHRIKRGRIVGVSNKLIENGEVISLDRWLSVPDIDVVAWDLVQEHQTLTCDELLSYLMEIRDQLDAQIPLSFDVMSRLIVKWKFEMVWSSNAIEGSTYTLGETISAIVKMITATNKPAEDAMNAIDGGRAIDYLHNLFLETNEAEILSERHQLELHRLLLNHSLANDVVRGGYRRCPIAVTGCPFVFPPNDEVPALMTNFFDWLNSPDRLDMHPVVFATEAHLRFVTIHPFEDGNGRMSRLIMNMVLLKRHFVPVIIHPDCAPEYKGMVRDYQVQKMNGVDDISSLLALVANEVLGAMETITSEL